METNGSKSASDLRGQIRDWCLRTLGTSRGKKQTEKINSHSSIQEKSSTSNSKNGNEKTVKTIQSFRAPKVEDLRKPVLHTRERKNLNLIGCKSQSAYIKDPSRFEYDYDEEGKPVLIREYTNSCVYRGGYLTDYGFWTDACIKVIKPEIGMGSLLDEIRVMRYIEHSKVTPFAFGIIPNKEQNLPYNWGLVLQFRDEVPLATRLTDVKNRFSLRTWLDLTMDIVSALQEIHNDGILINNICTANILVERVPYRRLRSFFVNLEYATHFYRPSFFTWSKHKPKLRDAFEDETNLPRHLAPEVHSGGFLSTQSDVYSLGYVLRDIINMAPTEVKWPEEISKEFKAVVQKCLNEVSTRCALTEIIEKIQRLATSIPPLEDEYGTLLDELTFTSLVVRPHTSKT